jgi:threonine dehydrogenase-like Zn-dependent dehydrogenase
MGHEFTGHVVETGSDVKTFAVGDKVVVPFTTNWQVPLPPSLKDQL